MSKQKNKKILILHGPNLNLIGIKNKQNKEKTNLSRINSYFKLFSKELNIDLIIFQTNDEARAINIVQKSRNKINGIIILPGPWQKSAHCLSDTLKILSMPFITISTGEDAVILFGEKNLKNKNLNKSIKEALQYYCEH